MNAVIYARYSSDKQTEQSIEGQLRVCKEYAEHEGLTIIGEYIDRAITGRYDDRPEFQKMIRDSKKRQFEYILVYKLDRFARNRRDSANYKYKLRMNGVRVLSAMERIGDNPESIILEAVLEAQAEYYSLDLAQKVKRGMRETVYKKKFLGGIPPYGYKVINSKIEIDEGEAKIIRYIFSEYANGRTKIDILNELNNLGIKSKRGQNFSSNSFQHALRNKKYIGIYEYDGEIIENYYPAIIDNDTFNKVQNRLTLNKRTAGKNKTPTNFYLTGKIFCGHCGNTMVGVSGTSRNGTKHNYYVCSNQYKKHTCDKKSERKDYLERYVCEETIKYVLEEKRIKMIATKVVEEYNKQYNNNILKDLQLSLSKIEKEIDKIVDSFVDATSAIRVKLNEKIANLDAQADELKSEIAKYKLAIKQGLTADEIIMWLNKFTKGNIEDEEYRTRIIDIFVNSFYVYDDKYVIYYNLKDLDQLVTIEPTQNDSALSCIRNKKRKMNTPTAKLSCSNSNAYGSQHGVRTRECRLERAMC